MSDPHLFVRVNPTNIANAIGWKAFALQPADHVINNSMFVIDPTAELQSATCQSFWPRLMHMLRMAESRTP